MHFVPDVKPRAAFASLIASLFAALLAGCTTGVTPDCGADGSLEAGCEAAFGDAHVWDEGDGGEDGSLPADSGTDATQDGSFGDPSDASHDG